MSLSSGTSFFETLGFSSCLFISCFCLSSRTSLYSLLVTCLDMHARRLLCSLLDVFVVYSKITMKKFQGGRHRFHDLPLIFDFIRCWKWKTNVHKNKKWTSKIKLQNFKNMDLVSETSFFGNFRVFFLPLHFLIFFSCISLYLLLVSCFDMYAWRLLCSLFDVFVVYSKFQWRSFKVEIEVWNGSIRLRARILSPLFNP